MEALAWGGQTPIPNTHRPQRSGIHSASKVTQTCQARWSLLFNRFQFIISYRPGCKNLKPDTLSRVYVHTPQEVSNALIIPSSKKIAPIRCDLENTVNQATHKNLTQEGGWPTVCLSQKRSAPRSSSGDTPLVSIVILALLAFLSSSKDAFGGQ